MFKEPTKKRVREAIASLTLLPYLRLFPQLSLQAVDKHLLIAEALFHSLPNSHENDFQIAAPSYYGKPSDCSLLSSSAINVEFSSLKTQQARELPS